MGLNNAERQRRWRERRNALSGEPSDIADTIVRRLGPDVAREIVRALDKRLRETRREVELSRA